MQLSVSLGDLNNDWYKASRGKVITIRRTPIIDNDTKIFTIGSCFAYEIRTAFKSKGFDVYPKYEHLEIDPQRQIVAKLHKDDNINHYDTFVIRQEFERAFSGGHATIDDFFALRNCPLNERFQSEVVYQDPGRKMVYGKDEASALEISRKFDECVRQGVEAADVYVITLGLIETWLNPRNGQYICRPPGTGYNGGAGKDLGEFRLTHFQENYENVRAIIDMIRERYPQKHIVISVSPVALQMTYTKNDIIPANTYSKSVLRAVAGQVLAEHGDSGHVHYMPSYEIAQYCDIYEEDGRHVTRNAANFIIDGFMGAFLKNHPRFPQS
jgi:hypothetical protein